MGTQITLITTNTKTKLLPAISSSLSLAFGGGRNVLTLAVSTCHHLSRYGKLLDNLLAGTQLESLVAGQESFALVGMASTLAAVCRVPLTSTLLLFELTRDYGIVLPTLGGVALSFLFVSSSEKLEKHPILRYNFL